MMKYYEIMDCNEYNNPKDIVCYSDNDFEQKFNIKHYDLNKGKVLYDYSEKIIFYYDKNKGNILTDYISNDLGWLIISPKFKTILENLGVNNVQYIPVEIIEKSTKDIIIGYNIVNIVTLVDALNWDETVYKVLKVRNIEHISVSKPVLDSNKLKDLHLVRVNNYIFTIFVSDILKNELQKNRISGCDFLNVRVV